MLRVMDDAKNPAKEEFGLLLKAARTRHNLQHQDIVRILGEANTQLQSQRVVRAKVVGGKPHSPGDTVNVPASPVNHPAVPVHDT